MSPAVPIASGWKGNMANSNMVSSEWRVVSSEWEVASSQLENLAHCPTYFPLPTSRLLTKSASCVLAALRGSTYRREYASSLRLLRPCWTAILNSLRWLLNRSVSVQALRFCHAQVVCQHPTSHSQLTTDNLPGPATCHWLLATHHRV